MVCNSSEPRRVWEAVRLDENGRIAQGEFWFTFDKQNMFNLFSDYPHKLSRSQKALFDSEYPYWAGFFKDRVSSD